MRGLKLSRWALLGLAGTFVATACGGRNELPTEGNIGVPGDFGGAFSTGGVTNTAGHMNMAGSAPLAGAIGVGGAVPIGGTVSVGGAVSVGGGATGGAAPIGGGGVCVPGIGFCKGNTIAMCDATGSGYVTMACPMATACAQMGDVAQCIPAVCKPGATQCDPTAQLLQVCASDGTHWLDKQNCAGLGQRCKDAACRSIVCEPNQRFCGDGGVRLCNADGSGSTAWQNCAANQYCDAKTLSCKAGICSPGQATCDGTIATTCNNNGSGYLMGGVDCAAQLDRQCVQGACLCGSNLADCDGLGKNGCETNVSNDPDNCGGCDLSCSAIHMATRTCDGVCNGKCQAGFDDCNGDKHKDGCETNLGNDAKNCGACGVVCSNNHVKPSCGDNACNGACAANFNDCNANKQADGCESDSRTDLKNCGSCGTACSTNHIKASCSAGSCGGDCNAGFDDCNANKQTDGCETNLNSDAKNCGACGNVCKNGQGCAQGKCSALYTFSGVAQNVPIASLVGWTQCYLDLYGNGGASLDSIQTQCTGSQLMLACRAKGSSTLQLAAYAPRADVLFDTGSGDTPHNANGVGWYFNNAISWGFAPQGDAIARDTCDTQDSSIGSGGVDGDKRLCWHTFSNMLDGGWRCGKNDLLNASNQYERLIFSAQ